MYNRMNFHSNFTGAHSVIPKYRRTQLPMSFLPSFVDDVNITERITFQPGDRTSFNGAELTAQAPFTTAAAAAARCKLAKCVNV